MSMLQTYCQLLEIDVDNFEIVGVSRIKNHCSNDLQFYTIRCIMHKFVKIKSMSSTVSTSSSPPKSLDVTLAMNPLKVEWSLSIDQSRQGCGDEYDTKKTEVTSQALIGFGLSIYYHIESLLESLIAGNGERLQGCNCMLDWDEN
ncbi:hypothetical protein Tco_1213553 [Tanacetum coccineum]